jgi:hypothetical protein
MNDEIPAAARKVIERLSRVPWVWDQVLEELAAEAAREPKSHFRVRVDLIGAFGGVVNAKVKLKREWGKPK